MSKTMAVTSEDNNPQRYIREFVEMFEQGKQCWVKAGKTLAEAVDKIPGFLEMMEEHCPQFPPRFIKRMLDLGRGALHEELLLANTKGEQALARLSYSWQEKYVKQPVEVLLKKEKDWDNMLIPVADLTPDQVHQVFDGAGIRTLAQQRVYLENAWARKTAPPNQTNLPYRIVGGKLVVMAPVTLNRKELAKLLSDME
jgi:hypothetical protein